METGRSFAIKGPLFLALYWLKKTYTISFASTKLFYHWGWDQLHSDIPQMLSIFGPSVGRAMLAMGLYQCNLAIHQCRIVNASVFLKISGQQGFKLTSKGSTDDVTGARNCAIRANQKHFDKINFTQFHHERGWYEPGMRHMGFFTLSHWAIFILEIPALQSSIHLQSSCLLWKCHKKHLKNTCQVSYSWTSVACLEGNTTVHCEGA